MTSIFPIPRHVSAPPFRVPRGLAVLVPALAWVAFVPSSAKETPPHTHSAAKARHEVYEVRDADLAKSLWSMTGNPREPETGRYRVLLVGEPPSRAYLLREGTQAGRLPDSSVPLLRRKIRSGELGGKRETGLRGNFHDPADPLRPFLWGTGMELGLATGFAAAPNVPPQLERRFGMTFSQRPMPWLFMELGGHLISYGGGAHQNLFLGNGPSSYWSKAWPWWHAAVGVPGIKWEIALADRPLPEYYWLDPGLGWASYLAGMSLAGAPLSPEEAGTLPGAKLLRKWTRDGDPLPPRNNLSHTVHVKAGALRYSAHLDPDVYRSVLHKVLVADLPAPGGSWAFGFFLAEDVGAGYLAYDLSPWNVGVGDPGDGNRLGFPLLRMELGFRDTRRFRIGASAGIRIDSRTFTYGDAP